MSISKKLTLASAVLAFGLQGCMDQMTDKEQPRIIYKSAEETPVIETSGVSSEASKVINIPSVSDRIKVSTASVQTCGSWSMLW